jgi:hypothetical protein
MNSCSITTYRTGPESGSRLTGPTAPCQFLQELVREVSFRAEGEKSFACKWMILQIYHFGTLPFETTNEAFSDKLPGYKVQEKGTSWPEKWT